MNNYALVENFDDHEMGSPEGGAPDTMEVGTGGPGQNATDGTATMEGGEQGPVANAPVNGVGGEVESEPVGQEVPVQNNAGFVPVNEGGEIAEAAAADAALQRAGDNADMETIRQQRIAQAEADASSGFNAGMANAKGGAQFGTSLPEDPSPPFEGGYMRGFRSVANQDVGPPNDGPPNGFPEGEGEGFANQIESNGKVFKQVGAGNGMRLAVDQDMVGGQAVVEGYNSELGTCGGHGNELENNNNDLNNQVGGGSPFNMITDPATMKKLSIFSKGGKTLLKRYVRAYKKMQSGGAALLEGVAETDTGALYDGVQNAGAEYMPDACGLTYDAQQHNWEHTQVGGGKNKKKKYKKCEDCKCPPPCECKPKP